MCSKWIISVLYEVKKENGDMIGLRLIHLLDASQDNQFADCFLAIYSFCFGKSTWHLTRKYQFGLRYPKIQPGEMHSLWCSVLKNKHFFFYLLLYLSLFWNAKAQHLHLSNHIKDVLWLTLNILHLLLFQSLLWWQNSSAVADLIKVCLGKNSEPYIWVSRVLQNGKQVPPCDAI